MKNTKKAFSLIEVLLAATIIVILLYALVAAGRSALRNSSSIHEKAQAMLLAQQGLEIVRQIRDTNWIDANQQNWSNFSFDTTEKWRDKSGSDMKIKFDSLSEAKRPFLDVLAAPADYEIISVDNLEYHRIVKYVKLASANMPEGIGSGGAIQPADNAVKVTVTVSWDTGTPQSLSISEVLTNWRPNY
ncbi:MAG: type II secretion system protein [Candidatus Berkelbacteria bacterium]